MHIKNEIKGYDNEEIFNNMIKFVEKHADDGIIQNKDGRSGVFKIEDGEAYIMCNNEKTIYDLDDELSKILDDGWLIE